MGVVFVINYFYYIRITSDRRVMLFMPMLRETALGLLNLQDMNTLREQ